MKKPRFLIFSSIFLTFLLPSILFAGDLNDIAYESRVHLNAGTIWNVESKGDCLLFPYYDVRKVDGKTQITQINIENFGEYGIAAKLRFRDWARGREVFSKDIWISSKGVWSGKIEISQDGMNAVISSPWNVIWRSDANTLYFTNPLTGGISFSTKNIRKGLGESTLYGFVEVIGEEKTGPADTGGKTGRLSSVERDCPNTLKGTLSITRMEDGAAMAYDAVAIGNFSRGQGSLFRSPGSPYPRLDTSEDTLDQVEFQLSKYDVFGPFSVTPSNQGKTSLIITYPTRHFHYSGGKRLNRNNNPFKAFGETQGETLKTSLSQNGAPLPADSEITLPYAVNIIGLYQGAEDPPAGIDNRSLPTYAYESGDVKLTSDNMAQRTLIDDYEYFREMFTTYRGLPAMGLIVREYRNPAVLAAGSTISITPAEFSAVWETSEIESILFPTFVNGPGSGVIKTDYTYTTGGASSSIGHPIQYQFDWGDGTDITEGTWLSVGVTSAVHQWAQGGVYAIRSRARCALHPSLVSKWSNEFILVIESISPPSFLTGPVVGFANTLYTYVTGGSSTSTGHPVQYFLDWGDGTDSNWLPVGTTSAQKSWGVANEAGYHVRAKARCALDPGVVSDWTPNLTVKLEWIKAPNTPVGPNQGLPGVSYQYTTGGASSNINHPIEYQFDWGDNTFSPWSSSPSSAKTWLVGTNNGYAVRARARCATDTMIMSDWSPTLTVLIEFITPPSTPTQKPAGSGGAGDTFTFTTSGAQSNIGDPVQYFFDWGDGTNSGWLSPGPAGTVSAQKGWLSGGSFQVKAKARCATHPWIESDWSAEIKVDIETVSIPDVPSGPTPVRVNISNTYTSAGSVSSLGHPLQYQFEWSDGTITTWINTPSASHAWTQTGNFSVFIRARCQTHPSVVSEWSNGFSVTVNP
jgi:hypothetical protein